jgi:zinc D-Ala-D-Ala carboxypeptidase
MMLSTNFSLSEFLRSAKADALRINNTRYTPQQLANMKALCVYVLEPLRSRLRLKFHPRAVVVLTSGWRCPALNFEVGGTKSSQHLRGQAADVHIEVDGVRAMTAQELFDFIVRENLVFDELIQEFDAWCHISYDPKKAQQRQKWLYAWIDRKKKVKYSTASPMNIPERNQFLPET